MINKSIRYCLALAISLLISIITNGQCTWRTILYDSFETNTPSPYIIPGTTYGTTPAAWAHHTGNKSLYLNFKDSNAVGGCPAGTKVFERVIPLCPNVSTKISAWFTTTFPGVQCKLRIKVVDSNNVVLQDLPNINIAYYTNWTNYLSPVFTTNTGSIKLMIYTNVGGGNGNDLSMDDLLIQNCHSIPPTYPLINLGTICQNATSLNLFDTLPNVILNNGTWAGPSILNGNSLGAFNPLQNTSGTYTYTSFPLGTNPVCPTAINPVSISVINPLPVLVNGGTICNGDSINLITNSTATSFSWVPISSLSDTSGSIVTAFPSTNTTYTVTENTSGCSGSDTANVIVNQIPALTVNSPTICPGFSATLNASGANVYNWIPNSSLNNTNSATVIASPTTTTNYFVIGTTNGCSDTINSTVTVLQSLNVMVNNATICVGNNANLIATGATNYTWTPSSGLSSNAGNSVIANPISTTTYTIVGNTNSCSDTAFAVVTVNNLPPTPSIVAQAPLTFCLGDNTILSTDTSFSYIWSNGDFTNPISVSNSGNYTVAIIDSNGCISNNSLPLAVQVLPLPTTPTLIALDNTNICLNDSVELIIQSNVFNPIYQWYPNATASNNVDSVFVNTTNNYFVTVTDTNGCTSSMSNVIAVIANPLPATPSIITSGSTTFCEGDSVSLMVNTSFPFVWSNQSTANSITVSNTGVYSIDIWDTCGIHHNPSVNVVSQKKPIAKFSVMDSVGCVPFDLVCMNQSSFANSYNWFFNNTSPINATSPIYTYSQPGNYNVTLVAESSNGCIDTAKFNNITVSKLPEISFSYTPDSLLINESTPFVSFYSTSQFVDSIYWTCNDYEINNIGEKAISITMPDTGLHSVTLVGINNFGCSDSLTKEIYVSGGFSFYIPNAFTPNNTDTLNNYFKPTTYHLDVKNYLMELFDRWGAKIAVITNPNKGWDGKINNQVIAGLYNWTLTCFDDRGVKYFYQGSVNVLK